MDAVAHGDHYIPENSSLVLLGTSVSHDLQESRLSVPTAPLGGYMTLHRWVLLSLLT